ncbi:MAG: hypothetical protein UT86_C0002G0112 [Candidatus Magasanikbacteria bacterium GW2011_GWC2_40_17]|uniref:Resolvase helix-turn-helix domain protein n=1 Tax=Candidatus Magasanikbacteria bacterium GW2011_GWA2_42_32 TaxID=1619039 RepID=A0A0G1D5G1_9BACT|nr:MAG: hypothetical protein UT86_C0002G0112 [Candidatus Magasanikbacteria bacterium GW2011_GWC2_40_17]KKS57273.1 MAG: hypothetical protein UV20_C0002G0062 [Candidatus Magasanikbacteria bacterium GW2011_GWA2_42_32]OGH86161.1 MAG: hypothetical protein A2294_02820 [Candidatus Magasanikbacteria bacterium RIFOXYB2_FULL_38_10]
MSKILLREKALSLRKKGLSYSQIKREIKVSKSTLSSWLYFLPLSKKRIDELRNKNLDRIEKFRNTMFEKRKKRMEEIFCREKELLLPLNKRELFLIGLGLYWGEGSKQDWSRVALANTDPNILKFFIKWLTDIHKISRTDLRIGLQLYPDMNIKEEIDFWSEYLKISSDQFIKPYIKKNISKRINHKGGFGHGTCTIMFNRVTLKEKILMQIKVLSSIH